MGRKERHLVEGVKNEKLKKYATNSEIERQADGFEGFKNLSVLSNDYKKDEK